MSEPGGGYVKADECRCRLAGAGAICSTWAAVARPQFPLAPCGRGRGPRSVRVRGRPQGSGFSRATITAASANKGLANRSMISVREDLDLRLQPQLRLQHPDRPRSVSRRRASSRDSAVSKRPSRSDPSRGRASRRTPAPTPRYGRAPVLRKCRSPSASEILQLVEGSSRKQRQGARCCPFTETTRMPSRNPRRSLAAPLTPTIFRRERRRSYQRA